MTQRLLVATTGGAGSESALHVAAALSAARDAEVDVLTVLEPMPVLDAGFGAAVLPFDEIERQRRNELLARVRAQVDAVAGTTERWTVRFRLGSPAHEIVESARMHDVSLVVLGLGRHEPADRIFGHETALRVSRMSPVPVLAVAPRLHSLPTRAIVAMDFSPSSIEAARAAARLMTAPGTLTLAHVAPPLDIESVEADTWERRYATGVAEAFARLARRLEPPSGVTVDHVVLEGDAAVELLALARRTNADFIAAGSHGYNLVERMLVGSVATKLLRSAHCSVLLAPAERIARLVPDERGAAEAATPHGGAAIGP